MNDTEEKQKPKKLKSMLSNEDIEKIVRRLDMTDMFAGIRMRNQKYPSCKMKLLVINQDDWTGGGTHWVGLIEFPSHFEYFDSFGLDCPEEVSKFVGTKKLLYNNDQMQNIKTKNCGWFVLYWAWLRLVRKFTEDIVEDDYINENTIKEFKARVNGSVNNSS